MSTNDPGFDRLNLPGRSQHPNDTSQQPEPPPRLNIGRVNPNDPDFYLNLCNATIVGVLRDALTIRQARFFLNAARTGEHLRRRAFDFARMTAENATEGGGVQ